MQPRLPAGPGVGHHQALVRRKTRAGKCIGAASRPRRIGEEDVCLRDPPLLYNTVSECNTTFLIAIILYAVQLADNTYVTTTRWMEAGALHIQIGVLIPYQHAAGLDHVPHTGNFSTSETQNSIGYVLSGY